MFRNNQVTSAYTGPACFLIHTVGLKVVETLGYLKKVDRGSAEMDRKHIGTKTHAKCKK